MSLNIPKGRHIAETEYFTSFSKDMNYLISFFDNLSDLISRNNREALFFSKIESFSLGTELIESSAKTLKSIILCCSIGSFSDANTLIRKFRDDLIQYVYMLSIITSRKPFLEESINDLNVKAPEDITNSILNLQFNELLTDDEEALTAWFKASVSESKRFKDKLKYGNYMEVLKQNENIKNVLVKYKLQEYWNDLSKRLNDFVHNNGIQFSKLNKISVYNKDLRIYLRNISKTSACISSFFLILLLMIDSSLIASSDYIDHLECHINPPRDSQYFIPYFVQDFIDRKVSKLHPNINQYLKENNISGMNIK